MLTPRIRWPITERAGATHVEVAIILPNLQRSMHKAEREPCHWTLFEGADPASIAGNTQATQFAWVRLLLVFCRFQFAEKHVLRSISERPRGR